MKKRISLKLIIAAMSLCVLLLGLLCLYNAFFHKLRGDSPIKNATLSLDNKSKIKNLYLDGKWEVFYDRLIVSDGLDGAAPDELVSVPRFNLFRYSKKNSQTASYRLTVSGFNSAQALYISLPNMANSYSIYVNGLQITSRGDPADGADGVRAEEVDCKSFTFLPDNTYQIVIETTVLLQNGLYRAPVLSVSRQAPDMLFFTLCVITYSVLLGSFYIYFLVAREELKRAILPVLLALLILRIFFTKKCLFNPSVGFNVFFEYFTLPVFALELFIIYFSLLFFNSICGRKMPLVQSIVYWVFAALRLSLYIFLPDTLFCRVLILVLAGMFVVFSAALLMIPILKGKRTRTEFFYFCIFVLTFAGIVAASFDLTIYSLRAAEEFLIISALLCSLAHLMIFLKGPGSIQHIIKERDKALIAADDALGTVALSQIKPHFMYNSLNTIRYLYKQSPKQGDAALTDFAAYLRSNILSLEMNSLIPFEVEREHIRRYILMEQLRFGSRVRVKYKINENYFMLPPLSIQPLVENAIKHGLCQKIEGGIVTIVTLKTPQGITVTVSDDGVGFDIDTLKSNKEYTSIGLKNIEKRIVAASGRLVIKSEIGVGTTATVFLPFVKVK